MSGRSIGLLFSVALITAATVFAGQDRPLEPPRPPASVPPLPGTPPPPAARDGEFHDPEKMPPFAAGIYRSARLGSEWLYRANRPDGLFIYGFVPSLDVEMEGDSFLRQIGGAFALARAARFTGNARYAVRARQAILAILAKTEVDAGDPALRSFKIPPSFGNRLGAAGLLVLAISELPEPAEDLLDQADQLCRWIARQQQDDGSLKFQDEPPNPKQIHLLPEEDREGINYYPGEALYGLMRSQMHRPAEWKTAVARKALPFYKEHWRKNPNTAFVPWMSSAYAEAYLLTREKSYAEFVFELSDWMCTLQYDQRYPQWQGGFATWIEDKAAAMPPRVGTASYAEGLADACRVARQQGDIQRHQRYRAATEAALLYLTTLQYTHGNTKHFLADYKPKLLGAFFGSMQDGNIRVDYTQHSICAMYQYLQYVADVAAAPPPKK